MIILAEGVDGAGKTTLVRHLSDAYLEWCKSQGMQPQLTTLHMKQPEPGRDPFGEYETELQKLAPVARHPEELVILDRWHTGEMPYGMVFRDGSRLTDAGMLHIEMALDALGTVKVLMQPPLTTVMERLRNRGDDFITKPEDVEWIYGWYAGYCKRYEYQAFHTANPATAQFILGMSIAMVGRAHAGDIPGFIGQPRNPRVLLAGDQPGNGVRGRPELPYAFTPAFPGGCGEYLMKAVDLAGLYPDVAIMNVNSLPDDYDLHFIWQHLGSPRVIALGSKAGETLAQAGIPFMTEYHPQYQNRFHHDKVAEYGLRIRTLALG
jgi:hypothetical protein